MKLMYSIPDNKTNKLKTEAEATKFEPHYNL